jgi:hypothetical protein
MVHPYKHKAHETLKSKTGSMGKTNNLDIPIMRAVGENSARKIAQSSASMQHKKQSAADGMKRGGHVGKPKHHKPKTPMVVPDVAANPPSPDPSMAAAGAAPSPAPAPPMPPGQPPMKHGGRKYAEGGRIKMPGSVEGGEGRLKLSSIQARKK